MSQKAAQPPVTSPSVSLGYWSDRGGSAAGGAGGSGCGGSIQSWQCPRDAAPALSNALDHGVQAVPGPEAGATDGPRAVPRGQRLPGPCAENQQPLPVPPSSGIQALQPVGTGRSWVELVTSWSRGRNSIGGCCPQPCCPQLCCPCCMAARSPGK